MDLSAVTMQTFAPLVGDAFAIADRDVELTLAAVHDRGPWPGGRDPFSLDFRGPREPLLAQAIYRLEHATLGTLEIFVVPVGRDACGTDYEAIFT